MVKIKKEAVTAVAGAGPPDLPSFFVHLKKIFGSQTTKDERKRSNERIVQRNP